MHAVRQSGGHDIDDGNDEGLPRVFLESTVIAQGLPWPENLETALAMEEAVRAAGARPATIAILEGEVRLGLSRGEIEAIAGSTTRTDAAGTTDQRVPLLKANRRDLAAIIAGRRSAATTVSATLWLARSQAGPCVMATGGLGGVHRGAGESFDVSTDLDELARADGCVVVCSGFKSILDLPATMEALETRGVLIVGYQTSELPAFTTRSSGLRLEHRVESAAEAAELIGVHRRLGLPGAIVVANPVAMEREVPWDVASSALAAALEQASGRGVSGKALTPFLLEEIRQATSGQSLQANRHLLIANARLAGEIQKFFSETVSNTGSELSFSG